MNLQAIPFSSLQISSIARKEIRRRMIVSSNIISCNFSSLPFKPNSSLSKSPSSSPKTSSSLTSNPKNSENISRISYFLHREKLQKKGRLHTCQSSSNTKIPQDPSLVSSSEEEENKYLVDGVENGDGSNGSGEERDWTTSFLLFAFWGGLMYYVFFLAPNQTPATDSYFLKKLLNLEGDDGFKMNEVLVALWYIMGLWPLVYSMLLLPTARSSRSKIPLWPFLILSYFGGAYLLIPYFVLWTPPAPEVEESEMRRWPLNFLDSKLTAGLTFTAGLAIIVYAILSGGDVWKEFYQYYRGSKFIHVTAIDFSLLSAFAPFWVYNDMTARKWHGKGSWLLPLTLIPFLGPALYLLLRPSLPVASTSLEGASVDDE